MKADLQRAEHHHVDHAACSNNRQLMGFSTEEENGQRSREHREWRPNRPPHQ
jgi:hypothetical protein